MSDYRFAAFHQPIDFDFTFKLLLSQQKYNDLYGFSVVLGGVVPCVIC